MADLNTRVGMLRQIPNFHAQDELELTPKVVGEFIEKHKIYKMRYDLLNDYYLGNHSILSRSVDASKPNNKLVDNFAEYITNVKTGYFMGKPVVYVMKDETTMQTVQDILDYNDEQDNNSELAKLMSINGHAFELLYMDEDAQIRFKYVSPRNIIMIYSMDIEERPLGAIRYYSYDTMGSELLKTTFAELYLADRIIYFKSNKDGALEVVKEVPHIFGDIPIIEYKNNDEKIGDFENVVSLIDAYELICSDSTNEVQYFNDAYLVIKNLLLTDETDIADMKNNRIIMLDNEGEADWLTKNINDTHVQNLLERITKDIHKFSKAPNLSDEEFASNLSGVAIRFKLWSLEQDTVNKERKFKRGLQRRLRLIGNILEILEGTAFDFRKMGITFVRNIPTNIIEQVQTVTNLHGVVSLETLLAQLPFIEDVKEELSLLKLEQASQPALYGTVQETVIDDEDPIEDEKEKDQNDGNGE